MIKTFYFNDLRTCCYLIYDQTKECAIVDPGCYSESEKNRLVKFVEDEGLTPKMILITHGHFDHLMGVDFVSKLWHLPIYMNAHDLSQLRRAGSYGGYFGYSYEQPSDHIVDLKEGDIISVGDIRLKVFCTPGHSQGGVVFYNEAEKYLLSGDSLFQGSIGRTDLPEGDFDTLIESIRTKILNLPSDTTVYPGHGPHTSIAEEIASNPFLH